MNKETTLYQSQGKLQRNDSSLNILLTIYINVFEQGRKGDETASICSEEKIG